MTSATPLAEEPIRRIYGRRQGRPLKAARQEVLERLLPMLSVPKVSVCNGSRLHPSALFGNDRPVWLEIGFGNGEHLAGLMARYPDSNFLGAEPFINGMAAFLKDIDLRPHRNVRVWMDDALLLVNSLADACLDGIFILNPDPWPKTRHHKRRIVNPANLDAFSRTIRPGGSLVMATDVNDLAEWMLEKTFRHAAFEWSAESAADWRDPPADWIETRYEVKGRESGRKQSYLIFTRK